MLFADATGDPLGFHEAQLALQFANADGVAVVIERRDFDLPTHAARAHFGAAVEAAHRVLAGAAVLEQMQAEIAAQIFADFHAALGIADGVEPRRKYTDAEMTREHRGYAATDAAL